MTQQAYPALCSQRYFFDDLLIGDQFAKVDIDPHFDTHMKLEGFNPAGSIKLKTAIALIQNCERNGDLGAGGHVIESSSGNLGVALAMVCANRGYQFTCVVDPNASEDSTALITALGANLVVVAERDANGGFLQTRINYIKQELLKHPGLTWTNQYANKANPDAHARTTAKEIYEAFPNTDYLFVGAGTTGTLMGCAQYFGSRNHKVKIIAVDVVGSVTFGQQPGPRKIPGLGTSSKPPICQPELVDDIVWVTEEETIRQCRWYAQNYGMVLGGSTGSVLAGIRAYKDKIQAGSTVVTISPDRGDKYVNTIYSDSWVAQNFPQMRTTSQMELSA